MVPSFRPSADFLSKGLLHEIFSVRVGLYFEVQMLLMVRSARNAYGILLDVVTWGQQGLADS
jgi:hypothetical protein